MMRFIQAVYLRCHSIRFFFYFPIVRRFFNLLLSFFLSILLFICLSLLILVQPTSGFQDYFTHSVSHSLSSFVPSLCSYVFVFSVFYFIVRLVFFLDFLLLLFLNRINRCG
ncbi:hypothetical protein DVT08_002770 [Xylella fastidiosa subsp. multiplex]|nr:hypothetical protein [Xylella fastidiosa subsp. multiplex]MRT45395.1 hypothetical protein [Xylella fastidiosa subsp. multiplex]MRT95592.1 hypothetical protein [Xylella fastidiosa subsp. multiplex]MRU27882.1 hypothetical protein [Xylella fastidiosa subsp. multiplex]MRU30308.1 hypothetical protein [Xylella fastidiosa subsp. multiplex]